MLIFLIPFAGIPVLCAWMYVRKKWISHIQSYLLNALITFLFPFIWQLFQEPVEISNQVPVFKSASIYFLGNIIFGIPSSLILQIFMNFALAPRKKSEVNEAQAS
jgi:hypothetical protein